MKLVLRSVAHGLTNCALLEIMCICMPRVQVLLSDQLFFRIFIKFLKPKECISIYFSVCNENSVTKCKEYCYIISMRSLQSKYIFVLSMELSKLDHMG